MSISPRRMSIAPNEPMPTAASGHFLRTSPRPGPIVSAGLVVGKLAVPEVVRPPADRADPLRAAGFDPAEEHSGYLKMLTARAATRRTVTEESDDSVSIISFALRVSGIASVGENAIEFVNET
jgi:hypothetical protein